MSILLDVQDLASARLAGINAIAGKASRSMGETEEAAKKMGRSFQAAFIGAAAGLYVLRGLTRIGAGLEQEFATIQATMSATGEEMEALQQQVADLGRTMPVSAQDAATAMKQFAFAGFEVEEAMNASTAAVELAVAGQMQMSRATKITGQMMNAFGIDATNVAQTTASLASTFSNSATNIENLASGMRYAAAQMSQLGFSVTEVNAALGTMADQGMEGTMAGTAMNQAWNKFIGQSGSVEKAMGALGMEMDEFTDKEGNMLPMVDVMAKMRDRLDEAGVEGAGLQRWLVDMFGQRGARAMGPMLENLDEFEEKIQDSALAQLKTAYEQLEELGDVEEARMQLLLDADDPESLSEELEELEDDEIIDMAEGLEMPDEPLDAIMDFRDQYQQGTMDMAEMIEMYQHVFGLEEEAARQLANMTADDELEGEQLIEMLNEATTQGELAAAQMETVGGKLKYMRGSFESAAFVMYQGFAPALERILDGLIILTDNLTKYPWLLKAFGAALFTVTAAMAAFTIHKGILIAQAAGLGGALTGLVAGFAKWAAGFGTLAVKLGGLLVTTIKTHGALLGLAKFLKAFILTLLVTIGVTVKFATGVGIILALVAAWHFNFLGLRDATYWVIGAIRDLISAAGDLINWFDDLPFIGKLVVGMFMPLLWIPVLIRRVGDALSWFSDKTGIETGTLMALLTRLHSRWVDMWSLIGSDLYRLAGWIRGGLSYIGQLIHDFFAFLSSPSAWYEAGKNLVVAIAKGIWSVTTAPARALIDVLGRIVSYLPSSDADRGPLSKLTHYGKMIPYTIAKGIMAAAGHIPAVMYKIFTDAFGGWFRYLRRIIFGLMVPFLPLIALLERLLNLSDMLTDIDLSIDTGPLDTLIGWLETVGDWLDTAKDKLDDFREKLEGFKDISLSNLFQRTKDWIQDNFDVGSGEDDDSPDADEGGGPVGAGAGAARDRAEREREEREREEQESDRGRKRDEARPGYDIPTSTTDLSREERRHIVYVDDRTMNLEMPSNVHIDGRGQHGINDIERQINAANEEARRGAMDDFLDFMFVGGPARLADDQPGAPPSDDEPEDGEDGSTTPEDGTEEGDDTDDSETGTDDGGE